MSDIEDSLKKLNIKLQALVDFLLPLLPLANSHLVKFITQDQWNVYLPNQLRKDLLNVEFSKLHLIPRAQLFESTSKDLGSECFSNISLKNFLNSMKNFNNIESSLSSTSQKVYSPNLIIKDQRLLEGAMNKKKAHEVARMSQFIKKAYLDKNLEWIVDIGCGLGYLSSTLLIHHELKVISIDSSCSNVANTLKRCKNLKQSERKADPSFNGCTNKIQKNLHPKIINGHSGFIDTKDNLTSFKAFEGNFVGITKFITTNDDINDLLSFHLTINDKENITSYSHVGVVGLHTCGNLSPTSLKLFLKNPNVKFICNVGCCYHLLTEEFISDKFCINTSNLPVPINPSCKSFERKVDERYHTLSFDPLHRVESDPNENGFPLCSNLRNIKFVLGRNARDLASKSTLKLSTSDKNLESLFWRALLEVIVTKIHGSWPRDASVGRKVGKTSNNFYDYCKKAICNLELSYEVSEEETTKFYEEYKSKKDLLLRFYFLKVSIAPLIENFILLDRLIFLLEQGFSKSELVQLFDEEISPRNYAIVSYK